MLKFWSKPIRIQLILFYLSRQHHFHIYSFHYVSHAGCVFKNYCVNIFICFPPFYVLHRCTHLRLKIPSEIAINQRIRLQNIKKKTKNLAIQKRSKSFDPSFFPTCSFFLYFFSFSSLHLIWRSSARVCVS